MSKLKILTCATLFLIATSVKAQEINWKNVNANTNHTFGICGGIDYSSYYGLSYGYHLKHFGLPVVLGVEMNVPFGKDLLDDWILRTGIQAQIFNTQHWFGAVKTDFLNRKYTSEISNIYNIGVDLEAITGYQTTKWGVAVLINYDRSIASKIKHKELKDYYPEISDGWYDTGSGNFKFGIRTNLEIRKTNLFLTLGKIYGQNFQDNPTLPFFGKLTLQKSF